MKQRKKIKKKRRLVLLLLCAGILLAAAVTAAGAVYLAPYAHAKMDMTLLQIPRAGRPSVLYAYDPEDRADRAGDLHPAENTTLLQDRPHIYVPYDEIPSDLINAFIAIDISQMMPIDEFLGRVEKMVEDLKSRPKAKGADQIFLPGEIEWNKRRIALDSGEIAITDAMVENLEALSELTGIAIDW